ncbi:hypothetical protein KR044_008792 [Drosophila immigrans]|nr:hypothetical protein KR044_008792 [Drosophila immigrans]
MSLLKNNIISREDWINLAKYYVSNHKPYNVKKYVPYKPSNKSITTSKPRLPKISSTTELPEVTTSLWETSTMGDLDVESTTKSDQAAETTTEITSEITSTAEDSTTELIISTTEYSTTELITSTTEDSTTELITSTTENSTTELITSTPAESTTDLITSTAEYSTTELITSTTELPSKLLSILGIIPGIETSTITSFDEANEATTTETTDLSSSTIDPVTSIDVTTEAASSTSPGTPESTTETIESTTQNFFSSNIHLDETTEGIDMTTQLPISTTEGSLSTTEIASSENDTTTTEPATSESTTEGMESTTQNVENSTTEKEVSTTLPTNFTGESNIKVEINKTDEISTFSPQSQDFNDDIIQNKLVNISYSTDVMPEIYYN